jgi:hypothetical protein
VVLKPGEDERVSKERRRGWRVSASPSLPCSKDKVIAFLRRSFGEAFRVQIAS